MFRNATDESREDKDRIILERLDKDAILAKVAEKLRPNSEKLTHLYTKLSLASNNNDTAQILKYLTKLCYFALDHDIDVDQSFAELQVSQVLFQCMNSRSIEQKVAAITFLTNVFRRRNTQMLRSKIGDDLPLILRDIVNRESDEEVQFTCFRCLSNIANDSQKKRDDVWELFKPDYVLNFLSIGGRKLKKAAARLLWAYCEFPMNNEQRVMIMKVIHEGIIMAHAFEQEHGVRILAIFIRAWADLAKCVEGAKILADDRMTISLLETILETGDNDVRLSCLVLISRILEHEIPLLEFDFEKVILWKVSLPDQPVDLVCASLRLMANAVIVRPDLCEMLTDTSPGKDEPWKSIEVIINDGNIAMKMEAILLIANVVRESSQQLIRRNILSTHLKERIIGIFANALYIEDPEVVSSVFCALAKMIRSEASGTTRTSTVSSFLDTYNGKEILEMLMQCKDAKISEQADVFNNLFIEPRQPFKFILPSKP